MRFLSAVAQGQPYYSAAITHTAWLASRGMDGLGQMLTFPTEYSYIWRGHVSIQQLRKVHPSLLFMTQTKNGVFSFLTW